MLVYRRVTPSIKFAGTHLYTWMKRGTVRVKCLAQKHNTMSPAEARTRTARSGDERANHVAIAPPTNQALILLFKCLNGLGPVYLANLFKYRHTPYGLRGQGSTLELPNRPFLNYLQPLLQSESWRPSFHMKMRFHSHVN